MSDNEKEVETGDVISYHCTVFLLAFFTQMPVSLPRKYTHILLFPFCFLYTSPLPGTPRVRSF